MTRSFFFSSRRRHTRYWRDWSSDVCSSDLEVAVLSTCNRTEVYLSGGDPDVVRVALEERAGLQLDGVLARWDDGEAVSHLFRVAAGLDSLVPGESQILGQVREAYQAARTAG